MLFTHFNGVARGIERLVTNEKVKILDTFCDASLTSVANTCRLFNGDSRGYYKLWLLVASITQFGVAVNVNSVSLVNHSGLCTNMARSSIGTSYKYNARNLPGAHIDYACR